MIVHRDLDHWREYRRQQHWPSLGFVPTMGGLHAGHRSLIEHSLADNEVSVVSLFLNPTQFDEAADLESYPAVLEQDLALLEELDVDHVLVPSESALYPDGFRYRITETGLSGRFCGAHRPGHFDGMLTVVMRLLNLVRPRRAYFGEKDFQQLELVRGMVEAYFLDVTVVPCATVREVSGLALSSRNARLGGLQQKLAPLLYRSLREAPSAELAARQLHDAGFEVDYVEDHAGRRLAAARLGDIRLIDNVSLENGHE